MAIRLVHLSTGDDGESHFTEGEIEFSVLDDHTSGKTLSRVATVTFAESPPGSRLSWRWWMIDGDPWRRVYVEI